MHQIVFIYKNIICLLHNVCEEILVGKNDFVSKLHKKIRVILLAAKKIMLKCMIILEIRFEPIKS